MVMGMRGGAWVPVSTMPRFADEPAKGLRDSVDLASRLLALVQLDRPSVRLLVLLFEADEQEAARVLVVRAGSGRDQPPRDLWFPTGTGVFATRSVTT
jgi:hypothetical protein